MAAKATGFALVRHGGEVVQRTDSAGVSLTTWGNPVVSFVVAPHGPIFVPAEDGGSLVEVRPERGVARGV